MRPNIRSIGIGIVLVVFAVCIDALQWIIGWAFFLLGLAGPTIAGAAGGYYACSSTWSWVCSGAGGVIGFIVNLIPGVGQVGGAIGEALGLAMAVVISLTLGPVLCMALWLAGRFQARYMLPAFVGEVIPFMGFLLPGWTGATFASVFSSEIQRSFFKFARRGKNGEGGEEATEAVGKTAPVFNTARFVARNAPPRGTEEAMARAEGMRVQVLQNISQGIKSVRPSKPAANLPAAATTAPANDNRPLNKRYGLAA